MGKNGWRFVNSYKFNDIILNFVKDDKSSNIRMSREAFTSQVEIWVGPIQPERPVVERPLPRGNDQK